MTIAGLLLPGAPAVPAAALHLLRHRPVERLLLRRVANARIVQRVAEKCYLPMNELLLRRIEASGGASAARSRSRAPRSSRWSSGRREALESLEEAGARPARRVPGRDLAPLAGVAVRSRGVPRAGARARTPHRGALRRATDGVPQHRAGVLERASRARPRSSASRACSARAPTTCWAGAARTASTGPRAASASSCCCAPTGCPTTSRSASATAAGTSGRSTPKVRARGSHALPPQDDVVGLFMDYETFGEHQWRETGIFEFMEHLPGEILATRPAVPDADARSPPSADPVGAPATFPTPVSWADAERDLTAWLGNDDAARGAPRAVRSSAGRCARPTDAALPRRLAPPHHLRPPLLHVHEVVLRRRRAQVLQPVREPARRLSSPS